ncbi:hypothetical protein C7999DRAFT_38288 [Corynascus novoguineensis]|uniref:Uncharacterized protein n=1 Tax=Corynascus novoguineensis TaxID=1126955 RepID=A0AAN7CYG8_9PEZI|nr:hypothetical protein C7999DRAFT_38288 [Corynascus novoguineensis]
MATHAKAFLASLGSGKRRTLTELKADTFGSDELEELQTHLVQQSNNFGRFSKWLSNPNVHTSEDYLVKANRTRPSESSRDNPIVISEGDEELTNRRQLSYPAHTHTIAPKMPQVSLYPPSSAVQLSSGSYERKRKASSLNSKVASAIFVRPPLSIEARHPQPVPLIDLTTSHPAKRTRFFLENRDDDVTVIDTLPAESRRSLQHLAIGTPRGPDTRPEKPLRQAPVDLGPAAEHAAQRDLEATPKERTAPETKASEVTTLMQSIESVTNFFTLATEIRDKIYRHLLVSPKPIHVQHLWTELARRSTRRSRRGEGVQETTIDTKILSVCRRTAVEGTRVLYSENTFLYILRDPEVVWSATGGRRSQRVAGRTQRVVGRAQREQEDPSIYLAKYGHLIRHMAIELEPNRTAIEYEKLMSAALETLAPTVADSLPSPLRLVCTPIHLHTLTITISPLFESSYHMLSAPRAGNQDVIMRQSRYLSMVEFFDQGSPVLKALQRLNTDFLRINVHVNSDVKNGRSVMLETGHQSDNSDDPGDSDSDDASSPANALRLKRRHLETTIDLRYLPRYLETLEQEPGPVSRIWSNDVLMQEQRRQKGAEAEDTLSNLRQHLEMACETGSRTSKRAVGRILGSSRGVCD